jgi:hypothetical protein
VIDRNVEVVRSEQRDKRQDLSAMAISYSGQLKNKKTSIPEHEFHLVTRKPVRQNIQHGTGELAQTLVLKMRSQVSREKRVLPRWPICRSRFVDFGGHFVFS